MEILFNSVHFSTESEMRIIDIDIRELLEKLMARTTC